MVAFGHILVLLDLVLGFVGHHNLVRKRRLLVLFVLVRAMQRYLCLGNPVFLMIDRFLNLIILVVAFVLFLLVVAF